MFNPDDQRYTLYPSLLREARLLEPFLIPIRLEDCLAQRVIDNTGNFILSEKGEYIYDD